MYYIIELYDKKISKTGSNVNVINYIASLLKLGIVQSSSYS